MTLSEHFTADELDIPQNDERLIQNAKFLCENVLEPIREHYQSPVHVTSGYRSPGHNSLAGGKKTSYHLYENGRAAADICLPGIPIEQVFLWLRMVSGIKFDKAILEAKNGVPEVIHLQVDRFSQPRRQAFLGSTGDAHDYVQVEVQ